MRRRRSSDCRRNHKRMKHETTKKLVGEYSKVERPVKDEEDKQITGIREQRKRWGEHFQKFLNRPAPLNPPPIEAAHTELPIDFTLLTIKEIKMATGQINSGKAAGSDDISTEALKWDIEVTAKKLHVLSRKIWEEEHVSMDWKKGHLVNIPMEGYLSRYENYRVITPLSVPGKVFNRVFLVWMKESVDAQLRD